MPRDLDLDFEFQDDNMDARPRRQAPTREGSQGMSQGRPSPSMRRKKNQTTSIIVLAVEIVVFIALIILFFVLKSKIDNPDTSSKAKTEEASQSGESGESSGGVNVDSDEFNLTCTKVQLNKDVDGNPVAMIYFTFMNKTDVPMAMSEVYPPSLTQNGVMCPESTNLVEYPVECSNKDMQVSGGQAVECCFAYTISDFTSPLTLTIHDNYSTFSDIGTTEIPLS